jgi:hypothetical protein
MVKLTTLKINQTIVHDKGASTFFSYDTPICTKEADGSVTLYADWAYSPTTSKYRSQFLNGETRRKLLEGIYTLGRPYGTKDK